MTITGNMLKTSLGIIVAVFVLTIVPVALAATPHGYRGVGGSVQSKVQAPKSSPVGQLPFTGTNLAIFGVAGLSLAGAGVSLRRFARRK